MSQLPFMVPQLLPKNQSYLWLEMKKFNWDLNDMSSQHPALTPCLHPSAVLSLPPSIMDSNLLKQTFIRRWMEIETEPTLEHWTELPGSR
ncbi:hypothetical protein LEMLEM_LOCUS21609 [Lemmus lemmus]